MRKPVLIALVVLMLIALCIGGWVLLVHRRANAELSSSEYDVLSAWITTKANEGLLARKIIVLNATESDDSSHRPMDANGQPIPWAETAKSLQEKAPNLQATTIEAFRKANAGRAIINSSFHIPIDYGLVDSAQLESIFKKRGDGWGTYYKWFPGTQEFSHSHEWDSVQTARRRSSTGAINVEDFAAAAATRSWRNMRGAGA